MKLKKNNYVHCKKCGFVGETEKTKEFVTGIGKNVKYICPKCESKNIKYISKQTKDEVIIDES